MYNIKEVSQVNNKYFFFVFSDGTQVTKTDRNSFSGCKKAYIE